MQFENHYHNTPPECSNREECWEDLAKYLMTNTQNKLVFFRETPQVYSELDFDTQKMIHRGFVRFSATPFKVNTETAITSLGLS